MNQLSTNFRLAVESWLATWRLHKRNRFVLREIRKHGRQLKEARKEADLMHKATGKAYYCLPDHEGNLRVLDKAAVKGLKKFKVMSEQVTAMDLLMEAEYHTINTHFVVLKERDGHGNKLRDWDFFRGTILECIEKFSKPSESVGCTIQILGGFERVVTIKDGKVIKH